MLNDLLKRERQEIQERWFDLILGTYPPDTAALMRKEKNRFTNPVGSTIWREIEALFKGLVGEGDSGGVSTSLNSILKIRSVQDFSPSRAVGWIFLLKKAIEETLKGDVHKEPILQEWLWFNSKIDEMALLAFDIYMDCREKICEIRVNKALAEKEMAFRMMDLMTDSQERRQKNRDSD